ncbi:hypothetical protein [Pantoea sp. LMR881]|uniref:hypothetical protein n=1 Tax=Pantoea sp. LMR881 TaxID=3014336 RepID=UPI0022AEA6FA|nr:hypothetical protein [Pantoea sp. LMR881]
MAGNTALSGTLNVSGLVIWPTRFAQHVILIWVIKAQTQQVRRLLYSGAASTKTGAIVVSGSTLSTSTMAIQAGGITTTGALSIGDSRLFQSGCFCWGYYRGWLSYFERKYDFTGHGY